MMKIQILLASLVLTMLVSCNRKTQEMNANIQTSEMSGNLVLSVEEANNNVQIPGVQSGCWGRYGNKLLVVGGRVEGFHGLIGVDTIFKSSKANDHLIVVDFDNLTFSQLKLNTADPNYLQFTASNAQFCQVGNQLYIAGGYGRANVTDIQSNTTIDRMVTIEIPQMISIVENGGNPADAVSSVVTSPFVQVTGGEMFYENGYFYIAFGQNYDSKYSVGVTGAYTNAVKSFQIVGNILTNSSTNTQDFLHRRDLNVEKVVSNPDLPLYAGYGGVFTSNDNGYENPVYIYPNGTATSVFHNPEISQITNQYNCALASVYNNITNVNTHFLIGGIGRYQYNTATNSWEDGDNGALLPFVKTITQMIWQGNELSIVYQVPPTYPELPERLGANAIFFPLNQYVSGENVIDQSRLIPGQNMVGYLYGGIMSPMATSSDIYPSKINNKLYKVILTSGN